MAFVYSIDEFGNIHTDDVTHITSNRGDGIIWRHAHEMFDDHIHTTSLSSELYMVVLQEIVHGADSIYCSVATYFSDHTIIKDVVLIRALVSKFEALLCKYVTSIGGIILLEELLAKVDNVHKSPSKYVSEYIHVYDSQLLHLSIPTLETLLCDHKTSIGGHIYLSNVLNIRDILTPGSMINYLKEVLQVTHTEHSSSKIYLDTINKIQDTIISHPILPNTNKIITSDKLQKLHTLISKSEIFKLYDTNRRSVIIYIDEHLKLIDTIIHNLIIFFRHTISTVDYIDNKIFIKLLDTITTIDAQSKRLIIYAIHQIQTIDDLILNPLIKFFDAIVTSDVIMIAKDIIKRIHNTATATKQKLTNAITIRRQL